MTGAILACFCLSGMCALVYQLIWTRWLGLVVGNFATATATVVTAFMGGLALGNWLIGRRASRLAPAAAVRLYATLEAGLAALAAISPALLSSSSPLYPLLAGVSANAFARAALCLAVLLPPTVLMGGTLPALVQALAAAAPATLGPLYALNTLGGAAGPLLAAFGLLPVLGLRLTLWLTAAVNAAVAVVAFNVAGRLAGSAGDSRPTPEAAAEGARGPAEEPAAAALPEWLPLVLAGVSGFLSLGFEIALTRQLVLTITGSSVYGFAMILSAYLLGLAAGAWLVRRLPPRGARGALVGFAVAQGVAWAFAMTTPFWDVVPTLLVRLWWNPFPFGLLMALDFAVILGLVLVLTTAFGYALPALAGALPARSSAGIGRLFAANTLGAVVGAPVTGFVLLLDLGLGNTLLVLGAVSLLAAIGSWIASQPDREPALYAWVGLPAVLAAGAWWLGGGGDPVAVLGLLGVVPAVAIAALSTRVRAGGRVALLGLAPAPLCLLLPFALPQPDASVMNAGMYNRPLGFRPGESGGAPPAESAHKLGRVIYQKDSLTGRIAVRALSPMEMSFVVNGKPDGSTSLVDMYTQIFMAHLPALTHPHPRRVLVIGCGTGTTTGCLTLHPEIEEIHLAEIEPAQLDVARIFGRHNYNGIDHPKVRIHLDDARHFLLTDASTYDVIVSEPSNLWVSGMVNLFTAEFYRSVRRHLNPGGVFFQWIHYYRIAPEDVRGMLATFTSVFPETTYWVHQYGDAFLMARAGDLVIDVAGWERRLKAQALTDDVRRIQMTPPISILGFFLWGPADVRRYCAGARICTDDFPYLEFTSPRVRYSPQDVQDMRVKMQFYGPLEPMPLAAETAASRVRFAGMFVAQGSFARAVAEYRRALALEPGRADAGRRLADLEAVMKAPASFAPATSAPAESFTR